MAASTLTFHIPINSLPTWQQQFDSIPSELPSKLEVASQNPQPSTALPLPRPIRVLTDAEIIELAKRGKGGSLSVVSRRNPQEKYLRLTPVVFTPDSSDALVYYEYVCGPQCAGGDAVWLKRDRMRSWKVRKILGFWVI
jgi:hypothetical protein